MTEAKKEIASKELSKALWDLWEYDQKYIKVMGDKDASNHSKVETRYEYNSYVSKVRSAYLPYTPGFKVKVDALLMKNKSYLHNTVIAITTHDKERESQAQEQADKIKEMIVEIAGEKVEEAPPAPPAPMIVMTDDGRTTVIKALE